MTAKFRIHPFLCLISVSLVVAVLAARPFDGLESILTGMSRVIYHLAIIIVCGSIIGMILDGIGGTSVIADDIIRLTKKPVLALNLLGFIAAVPVMCCILAYVIFIPFLVAVAIQTVQGSRLVTFLVVPGLILPVLPELGLPLEIALMSMASGTFMVSHANDSYFWTVIELADMSPSSGYRCYTVGGIVLGTVAFLLCVAAYVCGFY